MNDANFTQRLGRVRRALRAAFEMRAATLDITVPQFQVLHRLWEADGVPTSMIAKDICASGSTMTGILDRLEAKGLIARRPCPGDRRTTHIHLTEAGHALEAPMMEIVTGINRKALAGFSDKARRQFMRGLEKVGENLELQDEPAAGD
jgi:DNA-binding MarR family transcriptional regulator